MQTQNDTVIQFSGLKPGVYTYNYTLDGSFFERFENEELSEGNVVFEVSMERGERMLLFNFAYHGTIKTTCDRCLGEMEVPVKGEEQLCVKFSDTETSDDENVAILPESAFQIDLAQWMYEYVAIAMPIQKVHPEGECDPEMLKYLSDGDAGEEENTTGETDPWWDALKQLKG